LQRVSVMEKGRMVKKTLCAKCIKTLGKSAS
jgi:ribosomal protein L28